jgi:hypothetical protein
MWQFLVGHAKDYGFLGPIVGIVGLLLGASSAILFAFSPRWIGTWKPPEDTFPKGLEKVVGFLSAIGLFAAWIQAEPQNAPSYLHAAIYLAVGCLIAFLIYVGLWNYCPCPKPPIDPSQPNRNDVIWGGFWVAADVKQLLKTEKSVCVILAGRLYDKRQVWPPLSLMLSAVCTSAVLIGVLVCGALALSTAGASIQVALTGKPARTILNVSQVPGIPTNQVPQAPNGGKSNATN